MKKKEISEKDILDALTHYYNESIFITDGKGEVVFVNEEGARRIGAPSRDEVMHKNVEQLMKEGLYERSTVQKAIETKSEAVAILMRKTKNPCVSHSIPIIGPDDEV